MRLGLGIGLDIARKIGEAAVAPSNTVAPAISGTAVVGQVLTTTTGTWTGSPAPTYSYQWKRGATNIGTNSSTYTLVQADAGNTSNITCVVTATNTAGSANATSNTVAQILDANANTYLVNSTNDGNATFKSAINQFAIDLKTNSLWTKMSRIYPFLGGTSAKCAVDLVTGTSGTFNGTFTYSANGPLPNGTNALFDTGLNATTLTANSVHLSFDSFTNNGVAIDYDMGVSTNPNSGINNYDLFLRRSGNTCGFDAGTFPNGRVSGSTTDSLAYFVGSIVANNDRRFFRNGTQLNISTTSFVPALPNYNFIIFGLQKNLGSTDYYSSKGSQLSTIGSGLTAAEVLTLQTIRNTFQTAVSRSVGIVVSDPDAQAFVNAAELTSQTQANAINTLVIGMKAQSLWTKMEAIYPLVGGTAFSHKFNLKNPTDSDAAFRLAFNGTWTHTSSGAKPNGSNAYARTYCVPSSTARSAYGVYTTEQIDTGVKVVMAQSSAAGGYMSPSLGVLGVRGSGTLTGYPNTTKGMILGYDIDTSTSYYANINGTGQTVTRTFAAFNANDYYLGAFTPASYFSGNNLAFAFVGGLANQTEATALRTLVQAYQTSLGRQV